MFIDLRLILSKICPVVNSILWRQNSKQKDGKRTNVAADNLKTTL